MTYNFLQAELKPEDNTQIIAVADIKAPSLIKGCHFHQNVRLPVLHEDFYGEMYPGNIGKKVPKYGIFFQVLNQKTSAFRLFIRSVTK